MNRENINFLIYINIYIIVVLGKLYNKASSLV